MTVSLKRQTELHKKNSKNPFLPTPQKNPKIPEETKVQITLGEDGEGEENKIFPGLLYVFCRLSYF